MRWEKIILAALSGFFALLLYLLLPIETHKYRLDIEEKKVFNKVRAIFYADLDGDQSAEMVQIAAQESGWTTISMKNDWLAVFKHNSTS